MEIWRNSVYDGRQGTKEEVDELGGGEVELGQEEVESQLKGLGNRRHHQGTQERPRNDSGELVVVILN